MNPLETLARLPASLKHALRQGLGESRRAAVNVLHVYATPDADLLRGGNLDMQPARLSAYSVPVSGWVVARGAAVKAVVILCGGHEVARGTLNVERPDVASHLDDPNALQSGFRIDVKTLGLDPQFTLEVYALLDDGRRALLGRLDLQQEPLRPHFRPALNPILVTFYGRTGSTWLMRLLAQHPQILVYDQYPYEVRPLRYWLHVLRVLSAPADHARSSDPLRFADDEYWVGYNPFHLPDAIHDERLKRWLGQGFTNDLAEFCLRNVDTFYRYVMQAQRQEQAIYFTEKMVFAPASRLVWQLYPNPREIILVRDPRDVLASVLSFNAKRGIVGFRYNEFDDLADYLRYLRGRVESQLRVREAQPDDTYLLRYEDLIARPDEMLAGVFGYLGLDAAPERLAEIQRRASLDTPEMRQHRTSESPGSSIGRWRHDLSPELQAAANDILADVLAALDYPLS